MRWKRSVAAIGRTLAIFCSLSGFVRVSKRHTYVIDVGIWATDSWLTSQNRPLLNACVCEEASFSSLFCEVSKNFSFCSDSPLPEKCTQGVFFYRWDYWEFLGAVYPARLKIFKYLSLAVLHSSTALHEGSLLHERCVE